MAETDWISVHEKLPQHQSRVIAVCQTPNDGMQVAECWFTGNTFWREFKLYGKHPVFVSHWMDLPEPPEEMEHLKSVPIPQIP